MAEELSGEHNRLPLFTYDKAVFSYTEPLRNAASYSGDVYFDAIGE